MASLLREAHEIRRIQADVSALALADLDEIFRLAGGLSPEAARDLIAELLPSVTSAYGDISAAAAAEWFETLRERAVGAGFQARLAQPVGVDPVIQSVHFSAQHLFTDHPDQMQAYLQGQLVKWINQPARETIIDSIDADPIGRGWQRVVRPGGCKFCRMLGQRGAVYTRKSVWFASHANCNCGAVPSWDPDLPEVDVKAYEASKRMDAVRRRAEDPSDPVKQAKAQRVLDDHRARTKAWLNDMPD